MLLHDALLYQVLSAVLGVGAAAFYLWSYQLKELAEPQYRPSGEGIVISIDCRSEMRGNAEREHASRGALATQRIATLLAISAFPMGFASQHTVDRVNVLALIASFAILWAAVVALRAVRTLRACERFDIEYYGSGRHKYEAFETAWASFEPPASPRCAPRSSTDPFTAGGSCRALRSCNGGLQRRSLAPPVNWCRTVEKW
jgi:hypothetical protein